MNAPRAAAWAAIALAGLSAASPVAGAAPLSAAAALARQLAQTGRAEATLRWVSPASPGLPGRAVHARLALETPDRVRLDVTGSGERLVVRSDGGEWLQPSTRQLLRLRPRQSALAMRWWRALLGAEPGAREHPLGAGRYRIVLAAGASQSADSAEVQLDVHGLPAKLVVGAGEDELVYRLSSWRFMRPRGPADFHLQAPAGWETEDLP